MTLNIGPVTAAPIKVLVVEDHPPVASVAAGYVQSMGYRALVAHDGEEAVRVFEAARPDLVLMDICLPGIDGFETARRIKAAAPGWVPLVFMTAHEGEAPIAQAMQAGADDYIVKPLNLPSLRMKLDALVRTLGMQRQLAQKSAELESYYQAAEAELRVAGHLMKQLVHADRLRDPLVSCWLQPARNLSGDVIAAARTPGGVLHLLLADGTGHGLAASLNVLPVVDPFYAMTGKGYGLGAIAREINSKTHAWLPVGNFVAATLIAYDPCEGMLETWIGGNPAPFVLDRRGRMVYEFTNLHLPLGVHGDAEFNPDTEVMQLGADCQLIVYSDGVTEAESPGGVPFGTERLHKVLRSEPTSGRLERLKDALHGHCEGLSYSDDISIALIDCARLPHAVAAAPSRSAAAAREIQAGDWQLHLRLSPCELRYLDAVPMLLGLIGEFRDARPHRAELFLVLSELFNNALDHGLLRLDSGLKDEAAGMERFLDVRQARLETLFEGSIEIGLRICHTGSSAQLEIRIRDSGAGFDFAPYLAQATPDAGRPHGRGIALVAGLCASVEFHGRGNEVTVLFPLSGGAATDLSEPLAA